MIRYYNLLILLFCFLTNSISAQNTSPAWTGVYQGLGDNTDKFNKIISDGSGNFIGVGYTIKNGNYRDILTVKFNSAGDTLWWRTKNGRASGDDEGIAAGVDASGNVFVTGYADGGNSQNDIMVIKYNNNGVVQWDTTWNSPAFLDDIPVSLKIDSSGNCFIGGYCVPDTFTGSSDYITLKFATNGAVIWSQEFSRPGVPHGRDEISAMILDSLGNVYVTGRSFGIGNDDFVTIGYDGSNGNELWLQSYNGGDNDRATAIVINHAGDILITGRVGNGSNFDFRTIKYDVNGIFQWTRLYNGPANQDDRPTCIAVDAQDNVIVSGISDIDPSASSNYDFQTIKYDTFGNPLWVVRTGNVVGQDEEVTAMVVDASGNIFLTGKSDMDPTPGVGDYDFITVMYNSSGSIQWGGVPVYYAGSSAHGDDASFSLLLDGNGNLYVAGAAVNTITQKDATVIKYDIATGNQIWAKNYNGIGDFSDNAKAMVVDPNNFSYTAGYSFFTDQNKNAIINKFDPAGSLLCTYTFNGIKNDDDEFETMAISSNGSIYAAGYTKVSGQKSNILLVKWDPNTCDTLWTRTYDTLGQSDRAISIVLDVLGNLYLTGRSDQNPNDTLENYDVITIKYDSNGNVLWTNRFNGTGNLLDEPVKIILNNNGEVLVGGRTENVHDNDLLILKLNSSNGNPVWASPVFYNGPFSNDEKLSDIIVDASNNIFISGYSQTASGVSTNDPVLLKYDDSGNQTGFYSYFGDGNDDIVKMAVDINNNIYAAVKFDTQPGILNNSYNIVLKKFNNQLTDLWNLSSPVYNSPINGDDVPSDIKISPAGDIYLTGTTDNDTSGGRVNQNWITLGYNDQGNQIFISNYDGPNATDDSPNSIVIRGITMWVSGYSEGINDNQKDVTVNNYNLVTGINNPVSAISSNAYPNPFKDQCRINIQKPGNSVNGTFLVLDLLGNAVSIPQRINGPSFEFKRENLKSGAYLYSINFEDGSTSHGTLIVN